MERNSLMENRNARTIGSLGRSGGGGRKEEGRDERLASVRVCLDWIGLEIGNRKLPWMSEFDIRT